MPRQPSTSVTRRAALAGLAVAALTACSTSKPPAEPTFATSTAKPPLPAGISRPARLTIGSINLDEPIKALGLTTAGELEPPSGTVQWYDATVVPGRPGISVIAGHVTWNGPDVFYHLDRVGVGDTFTVRDEAGHDHVFAVTKTETVDKNALEHRQDVWGASTTPVVVLVTCDDRSRLIGHHHVANFVVWGKPRQ